MPADRLNKPHFFLAAGIAATVPGFLYCFPAEQRPSRCTPRGTCDEGRKRAGGTLGVLKSEGGNDRAQEAADHPQYDWTGYGAAFAVVDSFYIRCTQQFLFAFNDVG
jgi:hypothetical protein